MFPGRLTGVIQEHGCAVAVAPVRSSCAVKIRVRSNGDTWQLEGLKRERVSSD
jgi:hypothetical protein